MVIKWYRSQLLNVVMSAPRQSGWTDVLGKVKHKIDKKTSTYKMAHTVYGLNALTTFDVEGQARVFQFHSTLSFDISWRHVQRCWNNGSTIDRHWFNVVWKASCIIMTVLLCVIVEMTSLVCTWSPLWSSVGLCFHWTRYWVIFMCACWGFVVVKKLFLFFSNKTRHILFLRYLIM